MKIAVMVRQLDLGHILWCGVVRVERAHRVRVVRLQHIPHSALAPGLPLKGRPLHPDSMSFALLSELLCALAGIVSASRITTVKLAFVIVHPREVPKLNASTCAFSVAFVLTCRSGNRRVSFHL